MLKFRFFFIAIFFSLNYLRANDSIVKFKSTEQLLNISPYLYIYEDIPGTLTFNQVLRKEFKITKSAVPNLGISESIFWIKVQINNNSKEAHLLLNVTLPTLDKIEFYAQDNKEIYSSVIAGEQFPFFQRKYIDPDYLFDIYIPEDSIKIFYFKISSKEGIQLPIVLGTESKMFNQIKNKDIISGMYFGIMIAMILCNLFIFLSVKDISYIYYVVYIVLILITQTALQGYPFQYLWPNHPLVAQKSLFIFPSLVSIAGLEFIQLFLQLKTKNRILYQISYLFYLPYLTSIILAFAGYYKISFHIMEFSSMSVSIYMIITPIIILRQGFQPAKYFLAAWSVFLVGVCIFVLKDFGILPYNNFTRYTMQIGSAIETVLLSFALADRINTLKNEKEELIVRQNIILEQKVNERTLQLKETNSNLSATLINLKDTQTQLVNVEKMASLGQLTAGIAHEINNPINFVSANLKPLKMDISEILEVVKKYESIKSGDTLEDKLKEIEMYKKEIDLEYLKTEIETLLAGIEDGAKRTTEIVSGLKTFSRLDESEVKNCNINEGIESTLTLLKHVIPENLEVILNLGHIPTIECLPGKLNQVFMNILTNALHAVSQKKSGDKNTLTVATYIKDEHVYVSFEDTGTGMTEEIKNKIFEPFFTTKDVGEGTGLGMSIVFNIIETHQAKIEVETVYGKGTKIILILNKKIKL